MTETDTETWYRVHQGQSTGPLTGDQMEMLARSGEITVETLVWPGAGEWIQAGYTRLAPFFTGPRPIPDPPVIPATPTWSDRRAAFLKDKPRLRAALLDVAVVCDDGRHVASSYSDPIAPGESSKTLIDNFSPPGVAAATGCAPMQFEKVRAR